MTSNFEELLNNIIKINDLIRFVFITDEEGKIVHSKISTNSFLLNDKQASLLGIDMQILRRLLVLYDELIGKNTMVHLIREKVHVLIYYHNNWTILVSCDRNTDRHVLTDISIKIQSYVEESFN
ncbi:MAG: hypothetical protein WBV92_05610 [Nitrosotalea sp.]